MCNQHHTLNHLVLYINRKVGIVGIFSELQYGVIDEVSHQLYDLVNYAVYLVAVRGFMEGLGLFVKDCLAAMDGRNCDTML